MIDYLWEQVCAHDIPSLDALTLERREDIEVLVLYIQDCLEEWFINNRQLSAASIVRLSNSSHELMFELRRLNGTAPVYFEELRKLCQWILRRVHVREARQTVARTHNTSSGVICFD